MKTHEILIIAIALIILMSIQFIPQPKRKPKCNCEVITEAYKDSLAIEKDIRIRLEMKYRECNGRFN